MDKRVSADSAAAIPCDSQQRRWHHQVSRFEAGKALPSVPLCHTRLLAPDFHLQGTFGARSRVICASLPTSRRQSGDGGNRFEIAIERDALNSSN
uniref:Uncharacterized protein n=1 Tax=Hyaloperonospora arabidopsidis (strain Emoy2) TaxID=559515 RepID=M4BYW5_HYAAE